MTIPSIIFTTISTIIDIKCACIQLKILFLSFRRFFKLVATSVDI